MNNGTFMLTTKDNPFNPFKDFVSWLLYDKSLGYDSSDYLARVAIISNSLSEEESNHEIELAIDQIIEEDPFGIYVKISSSNADEVIKELQKLNQENLEKDLTPET